MGSNTKASLVAKISCAVVVLLAVVLIAGMTMHRDSEQSDDHAFWNALQMDGDEVESYSSFESMKEKSDLVVRGVFKGDVRIRMIQGDAPEDQVFMAVLSLVDEANGTVGPIQVEFLLPAIDMASAEHMAHHLSESLPDKPVAAFLRLKKGEGNGELPLYRLVSSDGIWIETSEGLHNPLNESAGSSFGPDQTLADLTG